MLIEIRAKIGKVLMRIIYLNDAEEILFGKYI